MVGGVQVVGVVGGPGVVDPGGVRAEGTLLLGTWHSEACMCVCTSTLMTLMIQQVHS